MEKRFPLHGLLGVLLERVAPVVALGERGVVDIRDVEHGLRREQVAVAEGGSECVRDLEAARRLAR